MTALILPICATALFLFPDLTYFRAFIRAQEDPASRTMLTCCSCYGFGTRVSYSAAEPDGKPDFCGAPYFLPPGPMTDPELFRFVLKQAEGISVPALRILAFCYAAGRGTARNPVAAMDCWRKAAALGDPASALLLSKLPGSSDEIKVRTDVPVSLYVPVLVPESGKDTLDIGEKETVKAFLERLVRSGRHPHVRIFVPGI